MSTPNFRTQENFPLYIIDDSGWDWLEARDYYEDAEAYLSEINEKLTFFQIKIRGGYYCGAQFFVEISDAADQAGFDENGATRWADNESTRYYLDMYFSQAKRKFDAEQRNVMRLLVLYYLRLVSIDVFIAVTFVQSESLTHSMSWSMIPFI